jgi:hypothetical protein
MGMGESRRWSVDWSWHGSCSTSGRHPGSRAVRTESRGSRPTTWVRQRSHGAGSAVFDVPSGSWRFLSFAAGVSRGPSKPRGAPGGFGGQLPDSQRTRSRRKASRPYGTGLEFYVRATVTRVLERGRKGRGGKGGGEQRGDTLVTFPVKSPVCVHVRVKEVRRGDGFERREGFGGQGRHSEEVRVSRGDLRGWC